MILHIQKWCVMSRILMECCFWKHYFFFSEPIQMSTLVSLAGGALAAFLLLICACIYAIRTEKCCFARKWNTTLTRWCWWWLFTAKTTLLVRARHNVLLQTTDDAISLLSCQFYFDDAIVLSGVLVGSEGTNTKLSGKLKSYDSFVCR